VLRSHLSSMTLLFQFWKRLFTTQRLLRLSTWKLCAYSTKNYRRVTFSRDYQDLLVLFIASRKVNNSDSGANTFLELGAFDGVHKSNCKGLEILGWTGIAIEANPNCWPSLENNRSCEIFRGAISVNETQVIMMIDEDSPSQSYSSKYGRPIREKTNPLSVIVPAISVQSLIQYWNSNFGSPPKYYSSDIEGMDIMILQEFLKNSFFSEMISIEHNHDPQIKHQINELCIQFGYSVIFPDLCRNDSFLIQSHLLPLVDI
jgi:hypothetical protein